MLTTCYGKSISQLLEKAYTNFPEKEAMYDGKFRYTYRDMERISTEIASGLRLLGVKKGDRVAVTLPVWSEFVHIFFAIAKLGAILVPFNTRYREDEAEYILKHSGAKIVFFPEEYDQVNQLSQIQSIKSRIPTLEHLISVRFETDGMMSFDHLREIGRGNELPKVNIDVKEDVFAFVYTSGTTGKPKGAMLTHGSLVDINVSCSTAIQTNDNDTILHLTPYFHIMGISAILRVLICQGKAVLMESFNAERALQLVEQERITIHPGVPSNFILELNHPALKKYDLSSLRLALMGGAPCPVEIVKRVKEELGCDVLVSYGMTETSPYLTYTSVDDDDLIQSETVGRALPSVKLKVVDDQRKEVAAGEIGELACQTIGIMKGYYKMPDQTREVIDEEGWYYSGDYATKDEKGYIRIVGRKKDLIIRGGYNIYPGEIEEVYYTHPAVLEVAIVGLADSVLGEVSCAAIMLKPGKHAAEEELLSFIKTKVADYKQPDHIVIVNEFPKTPTGKVKKHDLKEILISKKIVALR
jgi:fatty-acyl-CoA synthase